MEQDPNTAPPKPDAHQGTRDFNIISVSIVASDSTQQEVAPSVAEVQVRQDIFLSFVAGELLMTDGNDMVARLGLHGGEYMFLHFEVPEQKIVLKKAFRIYKIVDRSPTDSQQKFKIMFVSDELYQAHTMKISKAYTNTTVSDIARDVLENVLKIPSERIFIDKTNTPISLIVPYWNPVETLNWLAGRAHSPGSSGYIFYEDIEGFHFASLTAIYKRGTRIKVPYTLENKRGEKSLDMDKFAIDDYEQKQEFDILTTLQDGGFAMNLLKIDPTTRTTTEFTYDIGSLPKMYSHAPMSNQNKLFDKSFAYNMSAIATTGIEDWVRNIMAQAILNNSLVELTIPGNMGLLVGTMLNVRVPYIVTPAEGDMFDKRKSGKYLVVAVNHKFDLVQQNFTSLVWLARDSQPEPLPAFDPTLPTKINRLNSK